MTPRPERSWRLALAPLFLHLGCGLVFFVPMRAVDVAIGVGLYAVRMWAITVGYHRGFAHRSFKTSRPVQFLLALMGTLAVQRGPLWWAAAHRSHHQHADEEGDPHSPQLGGFFHAHLGWLLSPQALSRPEGMVADLEQFPELRWLDRFHLVPPLLLAHGLFWTLGTGALAWGFFVSTVALWHCVFAVNSVCHRFGSRRYETGDQSRNHAVVAWLTLGEGWHNNHHRSPGSARFGHRALELDVGWLSLRVLQTLGLVKVVVETKGGSGR